jgi:hypothetical protein
MMKVILRTCDKVASVHALPRPFGLSKRELIQTCFKSFTHSMGHHHPFELHIVADEISEDLANFFIACKGAAKDIKFYHGKYGNDASLMKMFEIAETFDDEDIVYFLEDDYLHHYSFGDRMTDVFEKIKQDFFVHPSDYPDQYIRRDLIIPAMIFLTDHCHWRQVSSTTFTFLCRSNMVKKYISHMKSSTVNADDGFLSKIFRETPCFSPLPGLATHMHMGTMSPLCDWEAIAKAHERKI